MYTVRYYGNIKKALIFHHTLIDALRARYESLKSAKEKQMVVKVTASSLLKKYRLLKHAQSSLGLTVRTARFLRVNPDKLAYSRKQHASKAQQFTKRVTAFYLRDDNSKMTPGKKDTVTRTKQKMQKRFLLFTMAQLHKKYLNENPLAPPMSYALFCRLLLFWVLQPTLSDRDTCACKSTQIFNSRPIVFISWKFCQRKVSIQLSHRWLVIQRRRNACTHNVARVVIMPHHITHTMEIPPFGGGHGK